jgi:hypothetical protein
VVVVVRLELDRGGTAGGAPSGKASFPAVPGRTSLRKSEFSDGAGPMSCLNREKARKM